MAQPLSNDQIQYILNQLPLPKGSDKESRIMAQEEVKRKISLRLRNIRLHPDAIDEFVQEMKTMFYRALVPEGMSVGFQATESIVAPVTQSALSSFHQTGSSRSINNSVEAMKNLFNISQRPITETMNIHFLNKKLSFKEVLDLRKEIVGVNLQTVIKKTSIVQFDRDHIEPWKQRWLDRDDHQMDPKKLSNYFLRIELDELSLLMYDLFPIQIAEMVNEMSHLYSTIAIPSGLGQACIDLHPRIDNNVYKLFSKNKVFGDEFSNEKLKTIDKDIQALTFIETILTKETFENIHLRGIKNVKKVYPVYKIVPTIIMTEYPVRDQKNAWIITINPTRSANMGIPIERLLDMMSFLQFDVNPTSNENEYMVIVPDELKYYTELLRQKARHPRELIELYYSHSSRVDLSSVILQQETDEPNVWMLKNNGDEEFERHMKMAERLGCMVTAVDSKTYRVEAPEEWIDKNLKESEIRLMKRNPKELIMTYISKAEDLDMSFERDKAKYDREMNDQISKKLLLSEEQKAQLRQTYENEWVKMSRLIGLAEDILRNGLYVYMETLGSNMPDARFHELIDPDMITTNVIRETEQYLGIEATRRSYSNEIYNSLTADGSYLDPTHIVLLADYATVQGFLTPLTDSGIGNSQTTSFTQATLKDGLSVFFNTSAMGIKEKITNATTMVGVGAIVKIGTGYSRNYAEMKNKRLEEQQFTTFVGKKQQSSYLQKILVGQQRKRNLLQYSSLHYIRQYE